MDGSIVKTAIKASGKTQEEAAKLAGIERETLVRLLKKDVPDAYVIMMRKGGIDIPEVIKSDNLNKVQPLRNEIEEMNKNIQEWMRSKIEDLEKRNKELTRDVLILTGRVDEISKQLQKPTLVKR